MERDDARSTLRRLYRDIDGFLITREDLERVEATEGSAVYGEIMPTAGLRLLRMLELAPGDVFVDLGCGVGKLVMLTALATTVRKVIGVELAAGRIESARRAVARAQAQGLVAPGRVELRCEDLLRTDLSEATVVYTCSTAFETPFTCKIMERAAALGRPLTFVSTQVLDEHDAFALQGVLRLDMSWRRREPVYVYRVNDPRARDRASDR